MTKDELAVSKWRNGYNCAQAVCCAFVDEIGVDEATLYKINEGFGAGMGTGKGVCGALSGAAALAGLINSEGDIENAGTTKASTYKIVAGMQKQFDEKVGSIICHNIKSGDNGQPLKSCSDCIRLAASIAEKTLFSK